MSHTVIHRSTPAEGVLLAEIERPPVNAYDLEMLDALEGLASEAASDPAVRVVVLASRLQGVFSAGADIDAFLAMDPSRRVDLCSRCREVQTWIEVCPKPFLALIEGACIGGGAEIVLACDVRFMALRTASIGFPEIELGLIPGSGGTQRLARRVGRGRALDLILSGRRVDAEEALALGLVEHVAEPEAVRQATLAYAQQIASRPAEALAAAKDAVVRGLRSGLGEGLTIELEHVRQRLQDPRVEERLRQVRRSPRSETT
jgi:enoyl-CoA hydratase/carnithine racemase